MPLQTFVNWSGVVKDQLQTLLALGAMYLLPPIVIAKGLMHASWRATLICMAVWYGALLIWGILSTKTWGEAIGWPMIMGLFLTIPATPIIVLVLRHCFGIR